MRFKPFFIHQHHEPGKLPNRLARGFTTYVTPDYLVDGNIMVSTAWCSPKDQFCKRVGRSTAVAAFPLSIPAKLLPQHIANQENRLFGVVVAESNFFYLYKRML